MDPSQDLDGASSDGEYEDDASLCAFLESEVLGEEEGGDVDDAPRSGAEAGGSDDEEAIAVLGTWLPDIVHRLISLPAPQAGACAVPETG